MDPQKVPQNHALCGTFSQRLRRLMDAAQISKQVDLAKILGVSPQTVSKAIKKQSIPFSWYKAISEKSGVPLEELTGVAPGVLEQFKRTGGALDALTAVIWQLLDSGPKLQATEQVIRMIRTLKGDSVDDLSHFLGLEPSVIYQAILRGSIPDEWTDELAKVMGISRDWLFYGDKKFSEKAPEKTLPATPPDAQTGKKIRRDYNKIAEKWALDLSPNEFKALWDHYWAEKEWRGGWLQAEITKRFPEFLEWLEQHQAPLTPAHIAALKKSEQLARFGPPDQPDDD